MRVDESRDHQHAARIDDACAAVLRDSCSTCAARSECSGSTARMRSPSTITSRTDWLMDIARAVIDPAAADQCG